MAERTRGVFQIIFKSIVGGLRPKIAPKFIGEDFYGTKYFEEPPESSGRKTRGRFFVPVQDEDFQQELPAEWEAWLRYRRAEPPTKEEVEANYQMILTKRENAAKLDAEHAAKKKGTLLDAPPPREQHAAAGFPRYKEYENFGRNDEPDEKK